MANCLIYNQNHTRLLYKFEAQSWQQGANWFTCACVAYSADTGEEFIAVGSSNGIVYRVKCINGQPQSSE